MAPPMDAPADFDSGAMAAVTASESTVRGLLAEHPEVSICNVNAPDQTVVGGKFIDLGGFRTLVHGHDL